MSLPPSTLGLILALFLNLIALTLLGRMNVTSINGGGGLVIRCINTASDEINLETQAIQVNIIDLLTKKSFKYSKQAQFSLGITKLKKVKSPTHTGKQLDLINYTIQNIVINELFEKYIKEECSRMCTLTGTIYILISNSRPNVAIQDHDNFKMIPGIGGEKGNL